MYIMNVEGCLSLPIGEIQVGNFNPNVPVLASSQVLKFYEDDTDSDSITFKITKWFTAKRKQPL